MSDSLNFNKFNKEFTIFYKLGGEQDIEQVEELVRLSDLFFDDVCLVVIGKGKIIPKFIENIGFSLNIQEEMPVKFSINSGEVIVLKDGRRYRKLSSFISMREIRKLLALGERCFL